MDLIYESDWIKSPIDYGEAALLFERQFTLKKRIKSASLQITALGVYEARINGKRVNDEVLAPGWTNYRCRVQYQTYDVTELLEKNNLLSVGLARGWRMHDRDTWDVPELKARETALIAALHLTFEDGSEKDFFTDERWMVRQSKTRACNLYNGDVYDAGFEDNCPQNASQIKHTTRILTPRQGERITEQERLPALELIKTPDGETVIDFGQNLTGYVEFNITGKKGERAVVRHAETLDRDGNFYTANLRAAKQEIVFVCDGLPHAYKPTFTFQGFRYIALDNWSDDVRLENFTAIVVHSEMKRTGYFECSDPLVNKLYENIIWGQKGNFLDVPTDCPQRDERLGWTGDAQAFVKTASLNYDVERFFTKWLADLALEQKEDGSVPHIIPIVHWDGDSSAGWADAAVICPWQIYLTYGKRDILVQQFGSMKKWVDYVDHHSTNGLWLDGHHFGDWLSLEREVDGKRGGTSKDFIASAFFAYSTGLLIKAGKVLDLDMTAYEAMRDKTVAAFRNAYFNDDGTVNITTQTACVLALYFGLAPDNAPVVKQLLGYIDEYDGHLTTGFLGTPYLLHVLTDNGQVKAAYDLLLQKSYPSWLYPVTKGATTMWEHWDSIKPDGTMWDVSMNSFNHYAYGAVGDWLYGRMAGINLDENAPGFGNIIFAPVTDERIGFVKASIETRHGTVRAEWTRNGKTVTYEFTVPEGCTASVVLSGRETKLSSGVTIISV